MGFWVLEGLERSPKESWAAMESTSPLDGTFSREMDNNKGDVLEEARETAFEDLLRQLARIHRSQEAKIETLHHEKDALQAAMIKMQRESAREHAGRVGSKESWQESSISSLPLRSMTYEPSHAQSDGMGEVLCERDHSDEIPVETTGDEKIQAISHGLSEVDLYMEDDELPPRQIQILPRWEEALSMSAARMTAAVNNASQLEDKKLVSSGEVGGAERRGCKRLILPPSDPKRMAWDLTGMVLLLYDMIAIPISAFDPGSSMFTDMMEWTTQIFWTFDIIMSLITGYVSKGQIVMSPFPIFVNYMKTWFLLDVIVVGPDWFMTFVALSAAGEDEGGSTSVSRLMRSIRVVRTVRLLRLVKLKRILDMLKDRITSEVVFILLNILKLIILLLLVNHFIAALWYSMGSLGGEGVPNWRDAYNMRPEQQSIYYRYATSLHWSLTQFTPATVDVHPQNMVERTFAILVLIFGLVLFSSFISSITASMTQLRNMQEDKSKQFWLLRRYLQQKQVPPDLGFKVLRYTEYATSRHGEAIPEHRITILGMLTKQLRSELRFVTHYRCLRKHGFFELVSTMNESVLHMMSSGPTLITKALAAQDPLFDVVDPATAMYFVDQGAVQYAQASFSGASATTTFGVSDRMSDKGGHPVSPGHINHLSLDPEYTLSMDDVVTASHEQGQVIQPGGHLCEVALWAKWKHVGSARALLESSIVLVSAKGFAECIRRDPAVDAMASVYAKTFVQLLNDTSVVGEEEQETSCLATKNLAEDLWHEYIDNTNAPNHGNFLAAANRFMNMTRKGIKERAFSFSTG